jgi:hypothetical protein
VHKRLIGGCGLGLLLLTFSSMLAAQAIPASWFGTWKLNVARSKADPGPAGRSSTVKIEANGNGFMTTIDAVNARGEASHNTRSALFDGKDVPIKGGALGATQAFTRIDDHTYQFVNKTNGRVLTTPRLVVAPGGRSFTTTTTGTNAQGQSVHSTAVFEKQ